MPGPARKYPDRGAVQRIVAEEARAYRARPDEVLGASNRIAAKRARSSAVSRIMEETGCSHRGLEKVWGASLKRLARRHVVRQATEAATVERLMWLHGDARTQQILDGKDPKTNQDLAAWKRLCALGGAR